MIWGLMQQSDQYTDGDMDEPLDSHLFLQISPVSTMEELREKKKKKRKGAATVF